MSNNILPFDSKKLGQFATTDGGEPPDMEQRLRKLEQDVAVIASNYSRREDLSSLELKLTERFGEVDTSIQKVQTEIHSTANKLILWGLGFAVTLIGILARGFGWI